MNINARISASGQSSVSSLETVMKLFHKDFIKQTDEILGIMNEDKAERLEQKKKTKLRAVVSPSSSTSTTTVISNQTFGGARGKIVSERNTLSSNILKHIISIDKNIIEGNIHAKKRENINFKWQSVQARFLSNTLEKWTGIAFKGPTKEERLLNAVENVERAIRQQESVKLDERTGVIKLLQSPFFKKNFVQLSKVGDFLEAFSFKKMAAEILSGKTEKLKGRFASIREGFSGLSGKAKTLDIGGAISKVQETIFGAMAKAKIEVSPELKKGINDTVGNILGSIANSASKFTVAGAWSWVKRKAITGAFTLAYGDIHKWFWTQVIFHPIKSYKTASFAMNAASKSIALYRKASSKVSEVLIDPIRNLLGIEKKVLGKTRFVGGTAIKAFSGLINSWLETGTMEASKKIGSMTGPLGGIIAIPFHAILSFLFKERGPVGKDIAKAGKGMAKNFTSMIWKFAKMAGLAIANLPFLIGAAIVGAIIGIAFTIYQYWDEIKEAFNTYIVDPITETFDSIVDGIKNIFTGLSTVVEEAIRALPFGDKVANSIFGEKGGSTDLTGTGTPRVVDGTPVITSNGKIDKANIAQQAGIDLSGLTEHMKGMKEALLKNQTQQTSSATPAPSPNIDDIGTYLTTQ